MSGVPVSPIRFATIRLLVGGWVMWLAGRGLASGMLQGVDGVVVALAGLSGLLLAAGVSRVWAGVLVLAAWLWIPGFHPLGWEGAGGVLFLLLLPFLGAGSGEPWAGLRRRPMWGWRVPIGVWQATRHLWMVTLVLHGVALLSRPGWRSGAVLESLTETPMVGSLGALILKGIPEEFYGAVAVGWGVWLVMGPTLFWIRGTERLGYGLTAGAVVVFGVVYGGNELVVASLLLTWLSFDGRWLPGKPEGVGGDVILFDGLCPLCHGTVEFVLDEAPEGTVRFAPLQGETARRLLGGGVAEMRSVVYVRGVEAAGPEMARESDAVLAIWEGLGGLWRVLAWARWLPKRARDGVYRWVARNRYRWFGSLEVCPLPPLEVRHRFLP
ncbi:MAG: DCC1-like thiol-disulfide oxidoreductase family protein [Verrucomicrobiia bacterium]